MSNSYTLQTVLDASLQSASIEMLILSKNIDLI